MILITCMTLLHFCHAQDYRQAGANMFGIGMTHPVMNGRILINFGHSINCHWSIGAGAAIGLPEMRKNISEDEKIHEGILSDMPGYHLQGNTSSANMEIFHWPWETYRNGFISIGCSYGEREGIDFIIGAGYMMRVFKGLAVAIKTETGLINQRKTEFSETISLNLNYIF